MAHTNVKNTFVGTPKATGGIWRYPPGLALPTNAWTPHPVGLKPIGGVSDEGYSYMSDRKVEPRRDWNGDKVRNVQSSKDDTLELTFIEFLSPAVMAEVHGPDNVIVTPATTLHGTQIATRSMADAMPHGAYVIDSFDGVVKRRRVAFDMQLNKHDKIDEKPGDWSVYKCTYDLFPGLSGSTTDVFTELDDKIVPTTWDIAVSGGAGTIVWSVDAEPTSALAYNVATSALKTGLEGLSTVGAGNATVTGTAGTSYHVVLANGGVLTAVGSGGAIAVVTQA
jgi:hypothetical protein